MATFQPTDAFARAMVAAVAPLRTPEEQAAIAAQAAAITNLLSGSCSTLEELKAIAEQLKQSARSMTGAPKRFDNSLTALERAKNEFLTKHHLTETDELPPTLQAEWDAAMTRAVQERCYYPACEKTDSLLRCDRCKQAMYCGQAHQKAHWKAGHKRVCQQPQQ